MTSLKHFLKDDDLTVEEQEDVLNLALLFSNTPKAALSGELSSPADSMSFGLLFEKPSLRTRVSSEVASRMLGANPVLMRSEELHFTRGETPSDSMKVLSGYLNLLMARVGEHRLLEEFKNVSKIPIVNGLSNKYHPLQALADLLTLKQVWGNDIRGKTLAYFGEGNNVSHSLLLAGAMQGLNVRIACPNSLNPDKSILEVASLAASKNGGSVSVCDSPQSVADGADALYTDVWVSMGDKDNPTQKKAILKDFALNNELLSLASETGIVLHCLPAHRGEEIEASVIDGSKSKVVRQAHNRLPATQALFLYLIAPDFSKSLLATHS